ncbi:apolipoprotein N-acyltransferase [Thalassotalea maritima]|uniref:apolipoprotein N-acyltransferase n=1 Tax=Thalassotalea maritima TaxID=3242416 RepID=UPI00352888B5
MATTTPRFQIEHPILAFIVCFLAGTVATFAFAPFGHWYLAPLSLLVWLLQINKTSTKTALTRSFGWGFGYFSAGISWVHVSIEQFGGLPLAVSLLLMALLCAYLALFPALSGYLSAKLTRSRHVNVLLVPLTWLVCEYLRSELLTGFPWLSIGYTQVDGPLVSWAPIIGEVGISFVIVFIVAAIAKQLQSSFCLRSSAAVTAVIAITPFTTSLTAVNETGEQLNVALVQGNIKQELRWDEKVEQDIIDLYVELTEPLYAEHDLIIWPEAAIPRVEPLAQPTLRYLNRQAHSQRSALVTGILNYDVDTRQFYNKIITLGNKHRDAEQADYYYGNGNHFNKHHLLPIGEFVPFGDLLRPIAPLFNLPMSSFSRGDYVQQNLVANDTHLLPLICFEIVFPNQLAANMTPKTDVILTISNDAWFGASHGPHQHLEIARMRAIEFAKPVLRATNNGLTAVIDHRGNIVADVPQFQEAILSTTVNKVHSNTLYSQYGRIAQQVLCWLLMAFIVVRLYWNRKNQNKA